MFQASRQLFHRSQPGTATSPAASDTLSKSEVLPRPTDRHPAMRGLDVSPVHGHHCICHRCEQHSSNAA